MPYPNSTVIGNQLGGTCLNVGCIPTKTIWQADHIEKEIERSKKFGYRVKGNTRTATMAEEMVTSTFDQSWNIRHES